LPGDFVDISVVSILAAYDLGAPAKVLQAIYDTEAKILRPIDSVEKKALENLTQQNWTNYLGQEMCVPVIDLNASIYQFQKTHFRYYSSYLELFKSLISTNGVGDTLENYVFSPAANGNGANMMASFFGGVCV
jgi:hypothetical protein